VKELVAAWSLFLFENDVSYEKLRNNSTITSHWKGIEYKTIKENVEMLQVKSILNRDAIFRCSGSIVAQESNGFAF